MSIRYLFHGSNQAVEKPELGFSTHKTDFGDGFYATESQKQAERWAKRVCKIRASGAPIVSVYQYEPSESLRMLAFSGPDSEWLDFVISNRVGDAVHDYDIVSGPVADEGVYDTIYDYIHGDITKDEAIVLLKPMKLDGQVLFHTPESIKSISFIDSYVVE